MDIHEELTRKLYLEKPDKVPNFKAVNKKKSKKSVIQVKSYAKNADLYESLESDISETVDETGSMIAEADIRSKIIEINGSNTFHDKALEEKWKENVGGDGKDSKVPRPNLFENNALMRSLLNQKKNQLKIADDLLDSASGKDKKNIDVNNEDFEGPCLIQSIEDPDFYYVRDTTKRDKVVDDGYRFSFRGSKKTTTPRSYSILEVTAEDFVFVKKK